MEEKNVPQREDAIPGTEPEATEVPLYEALTFTSEEALHESEETPREEMPETAVETAELTPVEDLPEEAPVEESAVEIPEEAAVEAPAEAPEETAEESPADVPEVPEEAVPAEEPKEETAVAVPQAGELVQETDSVDDILDDELLDLIEEEPQPEPDREFQDDGKEFDDMLKAPAPEEPAPPKVHEPRKGRPKRKKGEGLFGIPNILATVVWLALIVAIGVTAGRMVWVCAADVLAFGREDKPVTVTIYESDTMDDIIEKLYNNGLVRYRSLFRLYANISDAEEDIDPGIYDLNTRYDYHALVNMMSASSSRTVVEDVLIPEGYTCRQIFSLLEEKRICTAKDLAAYAASGELKDYWFLENVERGQDYCLEGFLFPDTYDFYKNSTPREVLEKLLDNFDYRFNEEMRAQVETLNANVTGGGYTVREVAIVASLIEKEAAAPSEAPAIAGVIYNRLFRWDGNPAYLNIDASIVYALDGKSDLTREDLQIDSPYNTYTHTGLTPTPIANPGLSSLQAALNPANHNYYYYVLNPETGMHTFSTTYEEHSANVAAYSEG